MSIVNLFEQNAETELIRLITAACVDYNVADLLIARGESDVAETYPQIVVNASVAEEAVFQSGIYQLDVANIVRTATESGSPGQLATIFGIVLDVLQDTELKSKLMTSGNLYVSGIGDITQSLADIGNQRWEKTATIKIFGYAIPLE